MLSWFDSSEVTGVGAALADDVSSTATIRMRGTGRATSEQSAKDLRRFLQKVEDDARSLRLNLYKRAKLAGSFKAKLLENGIEPALAEDLTRLILTQLASERLTGGPEPPPRLRKPDFRRVGQLMSEGQAFAKRGEHRSAADTFQQLIEQMPGNPEGPHGMGVALWQLGSYASAETYLRRAIELRPDHARALCNLGVALFWRGNYPEAENVLRRAIKAKPAFVEAQCNLASVHLALGRLSDAQALLSKVLRAAPRNAEALVGMGQINGINGRFDEARRSYQRALESKPRMPYAWAALAGTRKMTPADADWLQGAAEILTSPMDSQEEATLCFAMGKYFDDLGQYPRAFSHYQRANQLVRKFAPQYRPQVFEGVVSDLIRVYAQPAAGEASAEAASAKPLFVVGMPRSGTSLVEQIIASHPAAVGAGELPFWNDAFYEHEADIRSGRLGGAAHRRLAERYLKVLRSHGAGAELIVDKANVNSDYLGLIHRVFPAARFIYVQRHPIDTCLSCYFQQLSPSLSHTFDLADLAHYFRQHQRLMRHWKAVLPAASLLEVPYAQLVENKEHWIRRVLEFAGLDWQPQCLNFHHTSRPVKTASAWQVRQHMYGSSVGRWQHYEKYLGPLRGLIDGA
jgi:tetratricopeptide (TPR) repeat protein